MSDTSIDLVVRFSIKPGKLEAFRAKVQEIWSRMNLAPSARPAETRAKA